MAVKIDEIHNGEIGDTSTSASESRNYAIRGCKTKQEAYDAFYPYITNDYYRIGDRWLSSLNVREDRNDSPVVFYGEASWTWNERDRDVDDDPEYQYSTKGGTAHITFGKNVGRYTKDGKPVIPFQGIGPSPGGTDGNYSGCDIVVPAWSANVSVTLSELVAGNWMFHQMIRSVTGTMNSNTFMGCSPGELLYLGSDIRSRYKTNQGGQRYRVWDVSHEFIGVPNADGLIVEGINVAQKYGFDYMSVYYLRGEITEGSGNDAKKSVIQIARQVNVDRVYRPVDFSILGLPIVG